MSAPPQRRGEAGYNLVILIVAITILNIVLALSLPLWSTAIRREKEEELIFRGIQYAEAIRIFFNKYQQYPTRLEELLEREPRTIRQLWKDPMTEDGKWGLIFLGQQGQQPIQPPGQQGGGGLQRQPEGPDDGEGEGEDENGRESPFGPRKGEEVAVGPIVGVYSKSGKESIMTFFGKGRYDEWRFTVDILTQQVANINRPPGQQVGVGGGLTLSTRWLGRPLPYLDQYQQIPAVNQPPGGLGGPTGGQRPRPTGPRSPRSPNQP
jgi:type II secretory pathway pseudopilin PulG